MLRSITSKLVLLFAFVMLTPIILLMYFDYHKTIDILMAEAFDEMNDLTDHRKNAIESYINDLREEVMMLSTTDYVVDFTEEIQRHFFNIDRSVLPTTYQKLLIDEYKAYYSLLEKELGITIDSNRISNMLQDSLTAYYQYQHLLKKDFFADHPNQNFIQSCQSELSNIAQKLGFTDIYIIDNETGYVMYSIPKQADFAVNLLIPSFEESFAQKVGIVELFQKVRKLENNDEVVMSDYFLYRPSFDQPAAFLGTPIAINGMNKASLMVQLPVTELDNIARGLHENAAFSDKWISGLESYVISSDKKMRTNSKIVFKDSAYFSKKIDSLLPGNHLNKIADHYHTTILMFDLQSEVVDDAIVEGKGSKISFNYLGEEVLASYTKLELPDVDWFLITEQESKLAFQPLKSFIDGYYSMSAIIIFLLICIAYIISRIVSKPILKLVDSVDALKQERFDYRIDTNRSDEVGILAEGLNQAIETIGNNRKKIQMQYDLLEEREREIRDSINYAKIIQQSILPPMNDLKSTFDDFFIYYRPKDIVSGDFYWWGRNDTRFVVAAVDCTGHGVPGALLSMKANSILHKIVEENNNGDPAAILENLDSDIQSELRQQVTQNSDGMDISVISFDKSESKINYAGAHNSIFYWSKDKQILEEIKATRRSIGGVYGDLDRKFQNVSLDMQEGDMIYLMSDGVVDQIGGMSDRKLMKKNLMAFLQQNAPLPCEKQYQHVEKFFHDWMHPADEITHEQLDDMLLIGIKF